MTEVIPADIEINESILAHIIEEQFNFRPSSISFFGEGFDNAVYLVDQHWLFRLPRRKEAVELVATEMRVLPLLQPFLPLAIPHPVFFGVPSVRFPRPFYGHELIKGESGSKVHLSPAEYVQAAKDLAKFLRVLHGLNMAELGLSPGDLIPYVDRCDYQKLKGIFDKRLADISINYDLKPYRDKIETICEQAKNYVSADSPTGLVHSDIYHRHLIFDEQQKLNGIIDWGDVAIGDVVADLGIGFQFFPQGAREVFFATYGMSDEASLRYARFIGLYYAAALLWFGHDRKDQDLIRTSLWTLAEV